MGRKKHSKKRRAREKNEAARSKMTVEELRHIKQNGTGRGTKRNAQAHVPGYRLHEGFRREVDQ